MNPFRPIALGLLPILLLCTAGCNESVEDTPPPRYDVNITLDYNEVLFTTNGPVNVYVDDEKLGRQAAGTSQTYTIALEEGEYEFYLKNDGIYSTQKLAFNVSAQATSFYFGAKTRLSLGIEIWSENE